MHSYFIILKWHSSGIIKQWKKYLAERKQQRRNNQEIVDIPGSTHSHKSPTKHKKKIKGSSGLRCYIYKLSTGTIRYVHCTNIWTELGAQIHFPLQNRKNFLDPKVDPSEGCSLCLLVLRILYELWWVSVALVPNLCNLHAMFGPVSPWNVSCWLINYRQSDALAPFLRETEAEEKRRGDLQLHTAWIWGMNFVSDKENWRKKYIPRENKWNSEVLCCWMRF